MGHVHNSQWFSVCVVHMPELPFLNCPTYFKFRIEHETRLNFHFFKCKHLPKVR